MVSVHTRMKQNGGACLALAYHGAVVWLVPFLSMEHKSTAAPPGKHPAPRMARCSAEPEANEAAGEGRGIQVGGALT